MVVTDTLIQAIFEGHLFDYFLPSRITTSPIAAVFCYEVLESFVGSNEPTGLGIGARWATRTSNSGSDWPQSPLKESLVFEVDACFRKEMNSSHVWKEARLGILGDCRSFAYLCNLMHTVFDTTGGFLLGVVLLHIFALLPQCVLLTSCTCRKVGYQIPLALDLQKRERLSTPLHQPCRLRRVKR